MTSSVRIKVVHNICDIWDGFVGWKKKRKKNVPTNYNGTEKIPVKSLNDFGHRVRKEVLKTDEKMQSE